MCQHEDAIGATCPRCSCLKFRLFCQRRQKTALHWSEYADQVMQHGFRKTFCQFLSQIFIPHPASENSPDKVGMILMYLVPCTSQRACFPLHHGSFQTCGEQANSGFTFFIFFRKLRSGDFFSFCVLCEHGFSGFPEKTFRIVNAITGLQEVVDQLLQN